VHGACWAAEQDACCTDKMTVEKKKSINSRAGSRDPTGTSLLKVELHV
jgi:hypothetical protein